MHSRPAPQRFSAPDLEPARGFTTEQIHGSARPDPTFGSRIPPIHLTAGFVFDDTEQAEQRFRGEDDGYVYTRIGNPTNADLERRLAGLERGRDAILLASGQAAITVAALSIVGAGDHVVASGQIYEGSRGLLQENLGRLGVAVDFIDDPTDIAAWTAAITPRTRMLFGETISNPMGIVLDVPALADVARRHRIPLVVDNTLATPYLLRPLDLGADVVVHSASKFLSGHGQALGGVLIDGGTFDWGEPGRFPHLTEPDRGLGGADFVTRYGAGAFTAYARGVGARFGATPSPFNAFLIRQGIETLSLRMRQHCANSLELARWLQTRPEVSAVHHPGLTQHRSAATAARLLPRGAGAVIALELKGGRPACAAFIDALRIVSHMSHLGDVRSLVMHPASTSHVARSEAEQRAAGITPGLLRLAIGIEDTEDLIDDLSRGLAAAGEVSRPITTRAIPAPEHTLVGS